MVTKKQRSAEEIRADWYLEDEEYRRLKNRLEFLLSGSEAAAIDGVLGQSSKDVRAEIGTLQEQVDAIAQQKYRLEQEMEALKSAAKEELQRRMQSRMGEAGQELAEIMPLIVETANKLADLVGRGEQIENLLERDLADMCKIGNQRVARPKISCRWKRDWRHRLANYVAGRLVGGSVRPLTHPTGRTFILNLSHLAQQAD